MHQVDRIRQLMKLLMRFHSGGNGWAMDASAQAGG
jgi:hypothetical protein